MGLLSVKIAVMASNKSTLGRGARLRLIAVAGAALLAVSCTTATPVDLQNNSVGDEPTVGQPAIDTADAPQDPATSRTKNRASGSADPGSETSDNSINGLGPEAATEPFVSDLPTAVPRKTVDAGRVSAGRAAVAQDTVPAVINFTRRGDFAVVVELDCSKCTGQVYATQSGRKSPWVNSPAPVTGSFLIDIFKGGPEDVAVILDADGPWKVTLRSWNDIPALSGDQEGSGSAVLYLSDAADGVKVTYTPADEDDDLVGRTFSAVTITDSGNPDMQLFGDSEAFTETIELKFPGIISIGTRGEWKLEMVK